jgi:hypothetical protein
MLRLGNGSGQSNWWRRLALLLAIVVSGISIAGYVALSLTVNGLPPYRPFPGWVAVLQPSSQPFGDQVQLMVLSDAIGAHPLVGYTVAACGPHPYRADLLIGGSAQLADIRRIPAQFAAALPPLRAQRLPDLQLGYGMPLDFGPVQLIHISLPQFTCLPSGSPAATGISGASEGIAGYAAAPFQQTWSGPLGWWHGPHTTQAWPLTGTLPGITTGGVFTGLAGLVGEWIRPDADIKISTPAVPLDQSIDFSIPEPVDPGELSWFATDAINPIARLTDTSSLTLLQDWIVVFAVGLGIGGSMLASLLFEWLRPHPSQTVPRSATGPAGAAPAPLSRRLPIPVPAVVPARRIFLLGALLILVWARRRRAGHRTITSHRW